MTAVYFTWPDRALSYTCAGCGACCKGLGIGIDAAAGQLVQLVARRPELAAFVRRRGEAVTAFNPRDRCWFLEDDGLCRIERDDGRAAKPASCRLFPFNRVFHLGDTMIVDYNSVICPLHLGGADPIAHADVLAEIESITDRGIIGATLPPEPDATALFDRERAIADACFAAVAATAPLDTAGLDAAIGAPGGEVEAFETLGFVWRAPEGTTLAAALTLVPSLRFNELWGPRQYAPRAVIGAVLPAMTRAWLGFAALGAQLAARPLGMQELTTVWSEQAPLAYAIARWTHVPSMKPGPVELPSHDPHGLVRALAQACIDNRKTRRPFGAVVTSVVGSADPVDRIAAIKLAEPVLRAAFARS